MRPDAAPRALPIPAGLAANKHAPRALGRPPDLPANPNCLQPLLQARVAVAALLFDACNDQTAVTAALQAFLGAPEMANTSTVLE